MLIKLVFVGKLKDKFMQARADEYIKWLRNGNKVEIIELADSTKEKEGEAIKKVLEKEKGFNILLTEEGKLFSSIKFAEYLGKIDKKIVFVIGGPYGLTEDVKKEADLLLSLSPLTFTHELARLLLSEQLFRASNILAGGSYHNE
ncbi:MAG: 23S rRNA (pseudouridine(1915)-N(3))-methyltransferase RlmH [Lentisphaeria bacterium]|nr:23S rRNA (pseudouridine(1915)-N(3))-methyltransferase RlmH [Lentisphaeria bacterium]MBR7128469.1 23S rRNA (pseudouridine(1915)-N(3))-methyltransferase RlmH [Lentisphaeria bacterium]